jgi:hypothetical protein
MAVEETYIRKIARLTACSSRRASLRNAGG